jgi:beta-glucanase (GH16 family)
MTRNARKTLATVTAALVMSAAPAPTRAADLFRDDFDGTSLNTSANWSIGTWQLGRTQLGFTPTVAGGITRLRLDTYNPSNPGGTFRGSEILSKQLFSRGSGIEFEARVRVNPLPSGLVTSFFTYNSTVKNGVTVADEIDFEFLSKHINASASTIDPVLLTTWNDYKVDGSNFGDPNVHSSVNYNMAGLDLSQFNTVKIRWLPDRVQWYVNDVPVRTSLLAVPDQPTPIRANFWAAGTDWPDAYSTAIAPTNNPALNATYLYDIDHIAVRKLFDPVATAAPNRVFTDRFKNGAVTSSDSVPGFWTPRNNSAGSTVVESASEPLKLTAAGAGYPHAQVASAVRPEFNFFDAPIAIEATGIGFTSTSSSYAKSILRLALSSQTLAANTDSEFTAEDAVSLRIQGDNRVTLGFKLDMPNANSEFANVLVNELMSGPVRGVKVVVHPTFYELHVQHDASAGDSTQVTSDFGGALSISLADWRQLAQSALSGNSALFVQSQLNNAGAAETVTALVDSLAVSAVRPTWQGGRTGSWVNAANWTEGVPNYVGANAQLTQAAAGPTTIDVGGTVTVGRLTFDGAGGYTLAGAGSLRIDTPSLATAIQVTSGNHTVAVPVTVAKDLTFTVAPASALTLTRPMTVAGGVTLTKAGTGTLELNGLLAGRVDLLAGTTRIVSDPAANRLARVTSLNLDPAATLDLTDGALLLDSPNGHAPLVASLAAAYRAGRWDGAGITSSTAAADARHATGLGYADNASSLLIRYTFYGDADLNGNVDGADLARLVSGMQVAPGSATWAQGDFNYDQTVDADDFALFNLGRAAATTAGDAVPEPGTVAVALFPLAFCRLRARSRFRPTTP